MDYRLQIARQSHSSCELGKLIYVFGGKEKDHKTYLNSIERFEAEKMIRTGEAKKWERSFAKMAPISETEIAIFGGC